MAGYLKWIGVSLVVIVLGLAVFGYSATRPAEPMPQAIAALQSDVRVQVKTEPWLIFQPSTGQPKTGFIFYPGGLVDPRAYAPVAHEIAARGYLVVIVPMPINLAFLGTDRAQDVVSEFPGVQNWALGGQLAGRSGGGHVRSDTSKGRTRTGLVGIVSCIHGRSFPI